MSKRRTREKKSAKPQQPAKPDEISVGRRFAQPYAKARLLFDHPHSYREWNIVGQYDVPGFFYLESRFRLGASSFLILKTRMEEPKIASFCSGVSTCGSMGSHPEGPSRSDGISLMLSRLRCFDFLHSRF